MSRVHKYDLVVRPQGGEEQSIKITFTNNYSVLEIGEKTPGKTLTQFLDLLYLTKGLDLLYRVEILESDNTILFYLDQSPVEHAWQAGIIANLISYSTFMDDDDPDLRYVQEVELKFDAFIGRTAASLAADLSEEKMQSGIRLSQYFPDEQDTSDGSWPEWPNDSEYFNFQIDMILGGNLNADQEQKAGYFLDTATDIIAWSGLETERSPEVLFEDLAIIFASEFSVQGHEVSFYVETPTSNFAPLMEMFQRFLANSFGVHVLRWDFGIFER